jgi:hypothetical protein
MARRFSGAGHIEHEANTMAGIAFAAWLVDPGRTGLSARTTAPTP